MEVAGGEHQRWRSDGDAVKAKQSKTEKEKAWHARERDAKLGEALTGTEEQLIVTAA